MQIRAATGRWSSAITAYESSALTRGLLVRGVETDSHAQRYHGYVVGRSVEPMDCRCKVLAHRAAVAAGRVLSTRESFFFSNPRN